MGAKLEFGDKNIALVGFCDVDWADDAKDRRSTMGYVFKFGDYAISWNLKRLPTIMFSTTMLKYMANS